jgi:hypothetical protein
MDQLVPLGYTTYIKNKTIKFQPQSGLHAT